MSQQRDGSWLASGEGFSFSTDQAAFQRLLAQIVDLDRQTNGAILRDKGAPPRN